MESNDNTSLKERNRRALQSFILWRQQKQEHEEEEADVSIAHLLLPNIESSPFYE